MMNDEEKLKHPADHLLIIVLGKYFLNELGGSEERSQTLAKKIIAIMDE